MLSYTPSPNYFGVDKFSLSATDCGYYHSTVGNIAEGECDGGL